MKFSNIVRVETLRYLTKITPIAKVLAAKHMASLQLLYTVGGNQARLDARTEFEILERSLKSWCNRINRHRLDFPPPYSLLHDQLPPLWRDSNSFRSNLAWLPLAVRSNCSEAICLAARTLFLEVLCSAVIFVKCRKVSTRTTLPNFINISAETALYSRFGGHNERRS